MIAETVVQNSVETTSRARIKLQMGARAGPRGSLFEFSTGLKSPKQSSPRKSERPPPSPRIRQGHKRQPARINGTSMLGFSDHTCRKEESPYETLKSDAHLGPKRMSPGETSEYGHRLQDSREIRREPSKVRRSHPPVVLPRSGTRASASSSRGSGVCTSPCTISTATTTRSPRR